MLEGKQINSARCRATKKKLRQDTDRQFIIKLALETGWTFEYINSLPYETLLELEKFDDFQPFGYQRFSYEFANIITCLLAPYTKDPLKLQNFLLEFDKPQEKQSIKDKVWAICGQSKSNDDARLKEIKKELPDINFKCQR